MSSSNYAPRAIRIVFALLIVAACKPTEVVEPEPPKTVFHDGFEDADDLSDLFPLSGTRWSDLQIQPAGNIVDLSGATSHSGAQSLHFVAGPTGTGATSKADVVFEGLRLRGGSMAWFEWWVWLSAWDATEDVFLWDLESPGTCTDATSCPEEGAGTLCGSPGRRLFVGGANQRQLMSDLGKWCRGDILRQDSTLALTFPSARWVRIRIRLFVSSLETGHLEVWQDARKVIDADGVTLPRADAVYTRMQMGITGNGSSSEINEVFMDDVSIWLQDPGW